MKVFTALSLLVFAGELAQLDSDDFDARERASARLEAAGWTAWPALLHGQAVGSAEQQRRCQALLPRWLQQGLEDAEILWLLCVGKEDWLPRDVGSYVNGKPLSYHYRALQFARWSGIWPNNTYWIGETEPERVGRTPDYKHGLFGMIRHCLRHPDPATRAYWAPK